MSDTPTPKPDIAAFLEELSALSRKHRISIGGCGCCGSPWLRRIKAGEFVDDDAHYQVSDGYPSNGDPIERLCFLRTPSDVA